MKRFDLPQIGAIDDSRKQHRHWYYYTTCARYLQDDLSNFTKGEQNFDTSHKKMMVHLSNLLS